MLDWVEQGLGGTMCELRLDKRYKGNALMLSVSGEEKTNDQLSESYTDMLKGLDLSLTTYYAAEKNICNIIWFHRYTENLFQYIKKQASFF
jgi:hypothetical protein